MRLRGVVPGLLALLAVPPLAHAQTERATVLKAVTLLFDGMRQHDSMMVQAAFATEGRLLGVRVKDGAPVVDVITAAQFGHAVGTATGDPWDERIYDPEVRIDGNVATVWAPYDFLLGAKWSHCGIDAFMLAKLGDTWRITQIADTRQQQGCKTPAAPKGQ
jgi:hypothetical protein